MLFFLVLSTPAAEDAEGGLELPGREAKMAPRDLRDGKGLLGRKDLEGTRESGENKDSKEIQGNKENRALKDPKGIQGSREVGALLGRMARREPMALKVPEDVEVAEDVEDAEEIRANRELMAL
ncbi:unnamed protein product [Clonostachys rhizophaga]|uniref:Uncharacterized protein n=1 Tax=Clonostachys rhizophaga TaxID=160324 RepID=A0A9N9VRP8_9HYPO|nr:unnamed protein product [Clonostachys rhizophaga]